MKTTSPLLRLAKSKQEWLLCSKQTYYNNNYMSTSFELSDSPTRHPFLVDKVVISKSSSSPAHTVRYGRKRRTSSILLCLQERHARNNSVSCPQTRGRSVPSQCAFNQTFDSQHHSPQFKTKAHKLFKCDKLHTPFNYSHEGQAVVSNGNYRHPLRSIKVSRDTYRRVAIICSLTALSVLVFI